MTTPAIARIFFITGLLATFPLFANPVHTIDSILEQSKTKKLAQAPYWLALGHYQPAANSSGFLSEVTSSQFFLSLQGARDPQQELEKTLRAIFAPMTDTPDDHAQCRFIARFHWLKKQLNLDADVLPQIQCRKFEKWSSVSSTESISLVFATGFMDNPASFYGHLLLKFNTHRSLLTNELLDQSLNYGANVPNDENPLIYIFRGIFGGYDASFSDDQFYRHNLIYGENELRDLWIYDLALNQDEVQQILHHSWELLGSTFTYYFLKENCAYRMAELLELVVNQPLLPQTLPWSMPATVFNKLMKIEHRGQALVSNVRFIPSRQNRFYDKYFSLNATQQLQLGNIIKQGVNLQQTDYQALSENNKTAVIDALFDYYAFRMAKEDNDTTFKQAKHKLLIERASLPAGKASRNPHALPTSPPHKGPLPGLLRTGLLHSKTLGTGLELQLRPAYYDNLGIDSGRLPDSSLAMFDLQVTYRNERLTLRSLDFINVQTLNVSHTNLPGDGGRAWSLRAGLINQNLSCDDCNVFRISGGIGKATTITRQTVLYGMLKGLAQTKYQDSGTAGAEARLGLWIAPSPMWKSHFMVGTRSYLNGTKHTLRLIRWENRVGISRNWDIRFGYEKQKTSEISAALSLYW